MSSLVESRGFFLNRLGQRLYFAIHQPQPSASADTSAWVWVFCNPLFEEKTFSHRVLFSWARRLAQTGQLVMRFDYAADGDSEGKGQAGTWAADIEDAVAYLRQTHPKAALGLFGLRAGALAAAGAAQRVKPQRMMLWEPVLDGDAYLQEGLRANLTTQLSSFKKVVETREQMMANARAGGYLNLTGHELGQAGVDVLTSWRLVDLLGSVDAEIDIVRVLRGRAGELPPAWRALTQIPRVQLHSVQAQAFWGEVKFHDDAPQALLDLSEGLAQSRGAVAEVAP